MSTTLYQHLWVHLTLAFTLGGYIMSEFKVNHTITILLHYHCYKTLNSLAYICQVSILMTRKHDDLYQAHVTVTSSMHITVYQTFCC